MAGIKADLKLLGFSGLAAALTSAKFREQLKKNVAVATRKNAHLAQREIRQTIKKVVLPKNAALTIAIKRSSKPLVDKGDLWQAVSIGKLTWDKAFVGILQRDGKFNIAKMLHEGKDIPVTAQMRTMFYYLWLASLQHKGQRGGPPVRLSGRAVELFARFKDWKPLKPTTRVIRIPKRPFIKLALESPDLNARMRENWKAAVQQTFRDIAKAARR